MHKLTVFISSTVDDFGPVRNDLRTWLRGLGVVVRTSEDSDFPVEDGVHSHEACVLAVEGCHVMILLVGGRYGGRYAGTPKSITRREYDEALRLRIPIVALVLRDANEKTRQWRTGVLKEPPFGKDTGDICDFIDYVRKGHENNWAHLSWDGSFYAARGIIQDRLNSLFVSYLDPHRRLRDIAQRFQLHVAAWLSIEEVVSALMVLPPGADDALGKVLSAAWKDRDTLFGFAASDRENVAIYRWDATQDALVVVSRLANPSIPINNRAWKSGEGHVGATWERGEALVAADLTVTSAWRAAAPTDAANYRSAVAVPLWGARSDAPSAAGGGTLWGVLVITSDRLDHFRDPQQIEVLTAISLALRLERFIGRGETP